jgi:hypothetical protein
MIGLAKIGLTSSPDLDEPTSVDAAIVNTARKTRGKKKQPPTLIIFR